MKIDAPINQVPFEFISRILKHSKLLKDTSANEIYDILFVLNPNNCMRVRRSIPVHCSIEQEIVARENAIEIILKEQGIT